MSDPSEAPTAAYFEDFVVGSVFRHKRGKTVGEIDVVLLSQLSMNSAQGHFNNAAPEVERFGKRVAFGGVTASLIVGLSAQDTTEQAVAEIGLDSLKLSVPVVEGDSLWAVTEVLAAEPSDRDDAGIVTFRHVGINQRDELVCDLVRRVLIRKRDRD